MKNVLSDFPQSFSPTFFGSDLPGSGFGTLIQLFTEKLIWEMKIPCITFHLLFLKFGIHLLLINKMVTM